MPANQTPQIKISERKAIADLAVRLTGSRPESEARLESCIVNILRRMGNIRCDDFSSYLAKVAASPEELGHLVSALTIHHTAWFREAVHLDKMKLAALDWARDPAQKSNPFTILSAGCSTGEEAYSIGLVLQNVKIEHPSFEYRIEGWDIDPVSVSTANRGIYSDGALASIPTAYHGLVLKGTERTKGYLTVDKAIRERVSCKARSLLMPNESAFLKFQIIFCRNVLIYFKPNQVQTIIQSLLKRLNSGGILVLGHSEAIEPRSYGLEGLGNSCYRSSGQTRASIADAPRTASFKAAVPARDSPTLPALSIARSAKANFSRLETPKSDPFASNPIGSAVSLNLRRMTPSSAAGGEGLRLCRPDLILIGASTGGTDALERLLIDMPQDCPPIVVVQHIAHAFAKSFAERLAAVARLSLGDPHESGPLRSNRLYMSWGDYHLWVRKHGGTYLLSVSSEAPCHSVRPSVDVLFESAARGEGCERILVCVLTGMGKDGAKGMLALRRMGAMTCTQDEKSSVVYGMPAEAVALGASQFSGNPEVLRGLILKAVAMPQGRPSSAQVV